MDQDSQTEAVFKSVRSEVDPVSGNDVPLGSEPENVRDDVPAMLSEGEYVVPADVVKFFGVKYFEDLRSEAKMGFRQMSDGGRIGGEPMPVIEPEDDLPFDMSELQTIDDDQPMMNRGGYIQGYAEGGEVNPVIADVENPVSGSGGGVTYVIYENSEGATMKIPFFNGVPMTVIPEGYFPQGTVPKEEETSVRKSRRPAQPARGSQAVDYSSLSTAELVKMVEDQKGMTRDLIGTGLGFLSPVAGLVAKFAFNDMANKTEAEIARRAESEEYADERELYTSLYAEASEEKPGLLSRIWSNITGEEEEESVPPVDQDAVNAAVREALAVPSSQEDTPPFVAEVPPAFEPPVAKPGEIYTPEITTTALKDVPLIEGAEAAIKRAENKPSATPDSLKSQTKRGAKKSERNRKKYAEKGVRSGVAFIEDADGSTREVDTYKTEDVLKAGINPGGR